MLSLHKLFILIGACVLIVSACNNKSGKNNLKIDQDKQNFITNAQQQIKVIDAEMNRLKERLNKFPDKKQRMVQTSLNDLKGDRQQLRGDLQKAKKLKKQRFQEAKLNIQNEVHSMKKKVDSLQAKVEPDSMQTNGTK